MTILPLVNYYSSFHHHHHHFICSNRINTQETVEWYVRGNRGIILCSSPSTVSIRLQYYYALFGNCLVTFRFCHAISLRCHWVFIVKLCWLSSVLHTVTRVLRTDYRKRYCVDWWLSIKRYDRELKGNKTRSSADADKPTPVCKMSNKLLFLYLINRKCIFICRLCIFLLAFVCRLITADFSNYITWRFGVVCALHCNCLSFCGWTLTVTWL